MKLCYCRWISGGMVNVFHILLFLRLTNCTYESGLNVVNPSMNLQMSSQRWNAVLSISVLKLAYSGFCCAVQCFAAIHHQDCLERSSWLELRTSLTSLVQVQSASLLKRSAKDFRSVAPIPNQSASHSSQSQRSKVSRRQMRPGCSLEIYVAIARSPRRSSIAKQTKTSRYAGGILLYNA